LPRSRNSTRATSPHSRSCKVSTFEILASSSTVAFANSFALLQLVIAQTHVRPTLFPRSVPRHNFASRGPSHSPPLTFALQPPMFA
jgi:hypothetical protein